MAAKRPPAATPPRGRAGAGTGTPRGRETGASHGGGAGAAAGGHFGEGEGGDEGAVEAFEALTTGRRNVLLRYLDEAVLPATRDKRLARALEEALAARERRLDRAARSAPGGGGATAPAQPARSKRPRG